MGKATNLVFPALRNTRMGSSYLGCCEVCKQPSPEIYCAELQRVYIRKDGQHYLSPAGGSLYGHTACLLTRHKTLTGLENFQVVDGSRLVTPEQLSMLMATHKVSL